MKLSARDVLTGKAPEARKGATTARVRSELPGGGATTDSIANEAGTEPTPWPRRPT